MVAQFDFDVKQARKEFARLQHERVLANLGDVTGSQIGSAHAVSAIGGTFFMVENSRGLYNEENELIEYKVIHDPELGYSCSCPCGQNGFNVKHPSRVCWHVRAALALALEMHEAFGEMEEEITREGLSNGVVTDPGMLAFCAARKAGKDINLGRPAWMMR